MTALAAAAPAIDLRLGRHEDVLAGVTCDALLTDPPYGAKTHDGHRDGVGLSGSGTNTYRNDLGYAAWSENDVAAFVATWSPRCRGWFVALTSHDLVPAYASALEAAGRYVFAPLPYVAVGSRVRLAGDGPSSWTCWIVVSRPRALPFAKWGTLPGAYVLPPGHKEERLVVGGKETWLMRALVRDYSRPGDLICDPCAGGATTLIAAASENRRAIGAEMDPETHRKAMLRIQRGYTPSLFAGGA